MSRPAMILAVLGLAGLPGCVSGPNEKIFDAGSGQAQLRSVQSRTFAAVNAERALRATIATLQDLGFVIERQLRAARELLLSTTLTVTEIGQRVGIADPYHFSKLFRRHTGTSPREFRARNGTFASPFRPSRHSRQPPRPGT